MRRVVLALLVLPPLVALGLLAWATLSHRPHPVRTGDALLNAYLQALVDSEQALAIGSYARDIRYVLSAKQWADLQGAYGVSPQYWLLRYHFGAERQRNMPGSVEDRAPGLHVLRLARTRGATDWIVLLNLVQAQTSAWYIEARQALEAAPPAAETTLEPWISELVSDASDLWLQPDIWGEVRKRHGAELTVLLDELAQAGADQALVHYYLAYLAVESGALNTAAAIVAADAAAEQRVAPAELARYGSLKGIMQDYFAVMAVRGGEMQVAIAELAAGNAAVQAAPGLGLPFNLLLDQAGQGAPLAGDPALTGLLAGRYLEAARAGDINFEQTVQALLLWASPAPDQATLQVLHEACCRWAQNAGTQFARADAIRAERRVLAAIDAGLPVDAKLRRQAVSQAQGQLDAIAAALNVVNNAPGTLIAGRSAWEQALDYSPAVYSGGEYLTLNQLSGYGRDFITTQTALAGPIREQFEALAAIDFTR